MAYRQLSPRAFALELKNKVLTRKNPLPHALVACSGGVDSMVLLELLAGHYARFGALDRLRAIYIHHNQRPLAETLNDEKTVAEACRRLQVSFIAKQLRQVAPGASENTLRKERYQTLADTARSLGKKGGIVFTAHHADDELETLLFRLIRGAHPATLKGIAPRARRRLQDGRLLVVGRPLLAFQKSDILNYARAAQITWHEDSTNRSNRYARNRIRNELIPLLEALRPGATRRLNRFFIDLKTLQPQTHNQPSQTEIQAVFKELQTSNGQFAHALSMSVLKPAVDLLLGEYSSRTTAAHWKAVEAQLQARLATRRGGGPDKLLQFPGGHALCFRRNRVFWFKNSRTKK